MKLKKTVCDNFALLILNTLITFSLKKIYKFYNLLSNYCMDASKYAFFSLIIECCSLHCVFAKYNMVYMNVYFCLNKFVIVLSLVADILR